MTRTAFARRPAAPTAHDLKLWAALVEKALKAADKPAGDQQPFRRAADRAFKARMPVAEQNRHSPFVRLVTLALGWWRLTPEQRDVGAERLRETAEAVAEILRDPEGAEAGRRVLPPGDR